MSRSTLDRSSLMSSRCLVSIALMSSRCLASMAWRVFCTAWRAFCCLASLALISRQMAPKAPVSRGESTRHQCWD